MSFKHYLQANKEDLSKIVPYLIAHKQIKSRAAVVMSLLRELEFLPLRYPALHRIV